MKNQEALLDEITRLTEELEHAQQAQEPPAELNRLRYKIHLLKQDLAQLQPVKIKADPAPAPETYSWPVFIFLCLVALVLLLILIFYLITK